MFIKLTDYHLNEVLVNPDKITYMQKSGDSETLINFGYNECIIVTESIEEIDDKIRRAQIGG